MRRVFVAGSHTDVGKTYVACGLIRAMAGRGTVAALKPLASGFDPDHWEGSDPWRLLGALGSPRTAEALDAMTPWRLRAPLAPPMAGRLEGRGLDLREIADWCAERMAQDPADLMLLEGVGGVMSPITQDATNLDLLAALRIPALLVGGSYLGAISHTLTAAAAMAARGLAPVAVVVSESGDAEAPDFRETIATVARFLPQTPVVAAPRGGEETWAGTALDIIRPGEES